MNTITTIIIIVLAMIIPPNNGSPAQLPPEDNNPLPAQYPLWWKLCPCKFGACDNVATMVQDSTSNDEVNDLPDNPIIEPEPLSICGQWAESGGHPCPDDNANIDNPPAYNNRNRK